MNRIVIAVGIIVVVAAASVIWLGRNLNAIVEGVIEREGSLAMGTEVNVGQVEIDLTAGTAVIRNLSVANPAGFSDEDMLRFDELALRLDLQSLRGDTPRITSIVATNPFVLYEMAGGTSNLDVIMERFASDEAEPADTAGPAQRLAIDRIEIGGIQARLAADRLPRPVTAPLGDIVLSDMEGTTDEIAEQVTRPLIAQLSRNAATALIAAAGNLLQEDLGAQAEEALRELQGQTRERMGEVEDRVNEVLNQSLGEDVRRGLGDLLRGGGQ